MATSSLRKLLIVMLPTLITLPWLWSFSESGSLKSPSFLETPANYFNKFLFCFNDPELASANSILRILTIMTFFKMRFYFHKENNCERGIPRLEVKSQRISYWVSCSPCKAPVCFSVKVGWDHNTVADVEPSEPSIRIWWVLSPHSTTSVPYMAPGSNHSQKSLST